MKNFLLTIQFCLLCLVQTYCFAAQTQWTGTRIVKGTDYTSVIFSINSPHGYKVFTLSHPNRLVVDITDGHLLTDTTNLDLKQTHFTVMRHGRFDPHTFRIVFDLDAPLKHFNTIMRTVNANQAQLVVDIYPQSITTSKRNSPQLKVLETNKTRPVIVLIDAGHGGKDPGTIGRSGTREKDVVLSIALRLQALINRDPAMHAVMTRDGDYFVTLRDRLRLARKDKADLFVAIHADSYFNNHLTGASVYALSQHGATTEAARWLARRENYSELGGVSLSDLGDQSYVLRSVLLDLAQTATISDSMKLGTYLLNSLQNVTTLHYVRVEQAPFMVLKSPDIPSVLIETGFLSNPREEQRLRQANYREKLAQAILGGIRHYVITHPITASADVT